jgi:ribosomal protein S5
VEVNVPAVAVKFADVAPEATVTDAGTVNAVALLDSVTVAPPVPAAWDNVTAHVAVPPVLRLVGLHDTWLTKVGARSDMNVV